MQAFNTIKNNLLAKLRLAIGVLTFITASLTYVAYAANTTATMSLSASTSSVVQGSNVVVTVNANVGSSRTDGAQVVVNFDTTKLQFVDIDYTGSPLNSSDPSTGVSGGTITVARYTNAPPGPSGSIKIASITFKALVNNGTTTPTIDKASSFVSDNSDGLSSEPASVTNTTISFQPIPPAAPAPAPTSASPKAPVTPAATPVKPSASIPNDPGPQPVVVAAAPVIEEAPVEAAVAPVVAKKSTTNLPVIVGGAAGALVLVGGAILLVIRQNAKHINMHNMVSGSDAAKPLSNTAFDQGMQQVHVDIPKPDTVIQPAGSVGPVPVTPPQPAQPQQITVIQPTQQPTTSTLPSPPK